MIHRDDSSRPLAFLLRYGLAALAGLALLAGATPATAQVTGINYTVSPIGARVYWDQDAGLSDGFLYGGELGLGFGQYLEVGGIYLYGDRFETDFSGFSGDNQAVLDALENLAARDVTVQRYGGKLRVNLGAGSIIPFLTAGAGIIRFDPDGIDASDNIYVNGGVGATFSLANRYTISVAGENLAYRFNAARTLFTDRDLQEVGLTRDNFNQQTAFNPAISASLKIYLGGRSASEMTAVDRALLRQFRGGGFRLAVEPFYGQIDFNDKLDGFPASQALAGVNAGFDLGPYVGVRGFYWRGTNEEKAFDEGLKAKFVELAFYGGELDLRFGNQFGSLAPYLILGGGYLNVGNDYEDFSGQAIESRYFAMGGGGVELPLSQGIKVQGGVRGLFMSNQDLEDLSEPSSVFGSLMYTAGINFNLGGSGRTAGSVVGSEIEATRAESRERAATIEQQLAAMQARLDSLEAAPAAMPAPAPALPVAPPPMITYIDSTGAEVMIPAEEPAPMVRRDTVYIREAQPSNLSGQTITIPVPEQGEIYIRFGSAEGATVEPAAYPPPVIIAGGMTPQPQMMPRTMAAPGDSLMAGGLSAGQIRQIVRQALAEQPPPSGLTAAQFDASLREMEDRLERRIARESNRLRAEIQEQPREVRVVTPEGQPVAPTDTTARRPSSLMETFKQRQLVAAMPFIGVRLGESTNQFLIGVRGDYRFPGRTLRFVPEAALGFSGDGVALSALGNVVFPFGNVITQLQPYAGVGVGFVTDSGLSGLDLTLNLLAGAEYTFVNGMTFFGEFSTLDFFDFNRVLVGYRLRL